ncbi:S-adenosyl-L-methionine-dependent methyltransferase [Stachybotrys elegans]|uniref:S-adenosyl-L-methionine-dependent methyltransferase n=1 Tax=Stachybotrys elegans TaxID=80388 RepID=A0A8K0WKH9_9HYPO|nr:S-adenosyl-L-methionine-dependent methyltransferase [Stachybotrys elegans]
MSSESCPVDFGIVTQPNDIGSVPNLIKELDAGLSSLSGGGNGARHEMLIKARTLTQALETPRETMIKHCWAQTGALAGLNFGIETGLWKLMAKNGDKPQRVEDLASKLTVDAVLLARLMRHLAAMGYLKEVGVNEYQTTNFTKAMSFPTVSGGYFSMTSATGASPLRFHEYSRKRGFKNPADAQDTALMYAYGTDLDTFSWQRSLGYGMHFNHHMGGYRQGRPPWMSADVYPVKERLFDGFEDSPNDALLVDIGGNIGHDLAEFREHHPSHPGRLIVQDLPVVIGQIKDLDPAIQRMEYDFHTEQPVKGARAYYMHSILHDWPDEVCQRILNRIKEAMKAGYSRLLINENVIPDTGVWWETSALDMVMLTLFSSRERTQSDWHNLLEDMVGLKIVKIWSAGNGVESLIEVELAGEEGSSG